MSNIEKVLMAVCRGSRHAEQIARDAGVEENTARTCLLRLKQKNRIRTKRAGGRAVYEVADIRCLLADCWK